MAPNLAMRTYDVTILITIRTQIPQEMGPAAQALAEQQTESMVTVATLGMKGLRKMTTTSKELLAGAELSGGPVEISGRS